MPEKREKGTIEIAKAKSHFTSRPARLQKNNPFRNLLRQKNDESRNAYNQINSVDYSNLVEPTTFRFAFLLLSLLRRSAAAFISRSTSHIP